MIIILCYLCLWLSCILISVGDYNIILLVFMVGMYSYLCLVIILLYYLRLLLSCILISVGDYNIILLVFMVVMYSYLCL